MAGKKTHKEWQEQSAKKNDVDKEYHRLWYAYLWRSTPFKEFCALSSDKERKTTKGRALEAKYPKIQLMGMYVEFGNPFKQNFEDWYKEQKKRGKYGENLLDAKAVSIINFDYYTGLTYRLLKSKGIENPTRKDVGIEFNGLHNKMQKIFLDIDLRANEGQVLGLVKKLFKERRDSETFSKYDPVTSKDKGYPVYRLQKQGLLTDSRLPTRQPKNIEDKVFKQIKLYLEAYDLRHLEHKTYKQIFALKKNEAGKIEESSKQGAGELWVKKAEKIIRNLEWAQEFPGRY